MIMSLVISIWFNRSLLIQTAKNILQTYTISNQLTCYTASIPVPLFAGQYNGYPRKRISGKTECTLYGSNLLLSVYLFI